MKRLVAVLLMLVLLAGLGGCVRESLKVTRVPICFADPQEGHIFHDVDLEWTIHYEGKEIHEIEMKLIFRDQLSDYTFITYRRAVNGEERHLVAANENSMLDVDILSWSLVGESVSFTLSGDLNLNGEVETRVEDRNGSVDMQVNHYDDQGNALLFALDESNYELLVQYAEMENAYPEWTYDERKVVSLLTQDMLKEFLIIFSA